MKLIPNKKYRLKQDYADATLGKIPSGMTATFVSNTCGSCRFRLPNGKIFGVAEKSALGLLLQKCRLSCPVSLDELIYFFSM